MDQSHSLTHAQMSDSVPTQEMPKNTLGWLAWWKVEAWEVQKEVKEYETATLTQSSRGVGLILSILSAALTVLAITAGGLNPASYIDAVLLFGFGYFSYRGKKWAMIGMMVLWTIEKLYGLGYTNIFVSYLWWSVYMHAFYKAYLVEKAREGKTTPAMAATAAAPKTVAPKKAAPVKKAPAKKSTVKKTK